MNHHFAWPFLEPVNTIKLGLPDYYQVIKNPMDLSTIKMRLENNYYWSAKECIQDFKTVFKNSYTYNRHFHYFVSYTGSIEKFFYETIAGMPQDEVEIVLQSSDDSNNDLGSESSAHEARAMSDSNSLDEIRLLSDISSSDEADQPSAKRVKVILVFNHCIMRAFKNDNTSLESFWTLSPSINTKMTALFSYKRYLFQCKTNFYN